MFHIADDGKYGGKLFLNTSIMILLRHSPLYALVCLSFGQWNLVRRAVSIPSIGKPNANILKIFRTIYSSDWGSGYDYVIAWNK
jgi:hypothetical protein